MSRDIIICDLDGTLFKAKDGADWYDRDFSQDQVIPEVKDLLDRYREYGIIFITGTKEQYRQIRENRLWLAGFDVVNNDGLKLLMRANNDGRPDHQVKREIYLRQVKDYYNVKFVLEDRPIVVRMWRDLGLFVFEVNNEVNGEF